MEKKNQESKRNTTWKHIYNMFKEEVESLNASYGHQGLKGEQNERVLIKFLEKFLPGKFKIEQRRVILDKKGNESKEQDIVIWNAMEFPPIFTNSKYNIIESVSACIEVKTTLNSEELKDCLLKIKHLRELDFFKRLEGDEKWQVHPPLCFIFAYDCVWKKFGTIINNVEKIVKENNIKPNQRFDYLYIMRPGIKVDWDLPESYYPQGIIDYKKIFTGVLSFNERWPQFFPSKLIKNIPIIIRENQVSQQENRKEGFFADLNIENQIVGMVDFLKYLCQALEDQKLFKSFNIISSSYTKRYRNYSGTVKVEPF